MTARNSSSSSSNSSCLSTAVKYMRLWKDTVGNFQRQKSRSTKHSSIGSKKSGKKGLFAPVAHRLVEIGGDNKTNLSCGGEYGNSGAVQLQNLTKLLFDCELDVNKSCNPANYPQHNDTSLQSCATQIEAFENATSACMKMTINMKTSEVSSVCSCWLNTSLANISSTVSDCKIQDTQKLITEQKAACTSAFAKCRKYEDDAIPAISACASSQSKLTAKVGGKIFRNIRIRTSDELLSLSISKCLNFKRDYLKQTDRED